MPVDILLWASKSSTQVIPAYQKLIKVSVSIDKVAFSDT